MGSDRTRLTSLSPSHDRHVDVGDDDVELRRRELAQAVHAVVGFRHAQVFHAGQGEDEELPHHR